MVATCGDEFSGGSDGYRQMITPSMINEQELVGLNIEQESIARDLQVHALGQDVFNHARRAGMIRRHIEWILNDDEDLEMKRMIGFLEQKYKFNLLKVVEQALPYLVIEHGESHPEFPMLRSTIDLLRKHV